MADKRLILTGFMGAGKSTVGSRAAEVLDVNFYDTDRWMETEAGIDLPALVKSDPQEFRKIEAEGLNTLLEREPGIISTGGGIVSTEIGRKALKAALTPVVWLQVSFSESAKRVGADGSQERPLFKDVDDARKLYEERLKWYEETASDAVDASRPLDSVVSDVVEIAQTPDEKPNS